MFFGFKYPQYISDTPLYDDHIFIPGCPNHHAVITNKKRDTNHAILSDQCLSQQDTEWHAPIGATDSDAEIIIDIGCVRSVFSMNIKNLKGKNGGTKAFTLFLSEYTKGPWKEIFTGQLPRQEGHSCGSINDFDFWY